MAEKRRARLTRNVATGVHRLEHAHVNCYLIEDGDDVTIVDAALPATWRHLERALRAIGHNKRDVRAIVLTHGHFDHVGFAARAAEELAVPVWVHPDDRELAAHPYRYTREKTPFGYPFRYPAALPMLAAMVAAGALAVKGVREARSLPNSGVADVPGHPTVIHVPGHTLGSCALYLPERSVLVTGDALVTLDLYTARRGPQLVAGAGNADSPTATGSLQLLAETDARVLLPGHGEPWRGGARAAVDAARARGAS